LTSKFSLGAALAKLLPTTALPIPHPNHVSSRFPPIKISKITTDTGYTGGFTGDVIEEASITTPLAFTFCSHHNVSLLSCFVYYVSEKSSLLSEMKPDDEYKDVEYWNARFLQEESYDWLVAFEDIECLLRKYVPIDRPLRILHIGCGNSTLSIQLKHFLHPESYICNQDFSEVLINKMRATYGEETGRFEWMVGDMTDLASSAFPPASFDIVIEKAALDALTVHTGDPWNPREEVREDVAKVMRGVAMLLRNDCESLFLSISFHQKHFRLKLLDDMEINFQITVQDIPHTKSLPHFLYICEKKKHQGTTAN